MQEDAGLKLASLKVDGGACANNILMQFQSDIFGTEVERPEIIESTALGAAYLAAIQIGLWKKEDIIKNRKIQKRFAPQMEERHEKDCIKDGRRLWRGRCAGPKTKLLQKITKVHKEFLCTTLCGFPLCPLWFWI